MSETPSHVDLKDRLAVVVGKAKKALPFVSLCVGVAGAFLMDRSPKSAWLVVAFAVLGWVAIIGFTAVARLDPEAYQGRKRSVVRAARFLALAFSQSMMQNALLFSLPFYVQAAAFTWPQIAFLVVIVVVSAVTLWDPLYERVVKGRAVALVLQGFAALCALDVVLPMLGLSNGASLVVAGLGAALGVPLSVWVLSPVEKKKRSTLIGGVAAGLGIPVVVALVGAPLIPPAPLRLVEGGLGRAVVDRQLAEPFGDEVAGEPPVAFCWTAIAAPRGLKDQLFHVWRHDGERVQRVPLNVSGGREQGFRTWSKKTGLDEGKWSCSVETAAGQVLGRVGVLVRP